MFTQSLISLVAFSSVFLPALAAPGPAWIRRQEDAQSSLTLDPATISHSLEQDGQGNNPDPGQVRSLTSSNNFINFCLGPLANGVPLTNGKQIATGSCNQTPMGRIISLDKAPRSKFVFPKNGDESLVENEAFTVQMKIINMQTGNFVNANANYYAAPQQVNGDGIVIGHSHVVIEKLPSLQTTEPLDPTTFAFFKGLNNVAANDILTADVTSGLAAGVYRICSINTASNHQPALVSNAQHGSLDDCSYFTVKSASAVNDVSSTSATASATETSASASVSASATQASDSVSQSASITESSTNAVSTSTESSSQSSSTESSTDNQPSGTESSSAAQSTSTEAAQPSSADSSSAQPEVTSSSEPVPAPSSSNEQPSAPIETPSSSAEAPSSSADAPPSSAPAAPSPSPELPSVPAQAPSSSLEVLSSSSDAIPSPSPDSQAGGSSEAPSPASAA